MKLYIRNYILQHFNSIWPNDYYFADFILSWILSHENYYYNYNYPTLFSLSGKCNKHDLCCVIDFIFCVANTEDAFYRKKYKKCINDLIVLGAPNILFSDDKYGIK